MDPGFLFIAGIGIVAGLLGGILGIGGAIIIIPALIIIGGYSQQLAQGTTLLMLSLPVGALAAWQYFREGSVDVKAALVLAISFFISGYFGAKIAFYIPQQVLKNIFAILLVVIGIKMLFMDGKL